jgi:sensor c-di-GMP phosphodiesterase-like protein
MAKVVTTTNRLLSCVSGGIREGCSRQQGSQTFADWLSCRLEATIDILNALKARGLRISIDDVGSGYWSLALLRPLPV